MISTSHVHRSDRQCASSERAASPRNSLNPQLKSRSEMPLIRRASVAYAAPMRRRRRDWGRSMRAPGLRRSPITMSAPRSSSGRNDASISGGVDISASRINTLSPRVMSTPARTAAPLPRFRSNLTRRKRGSSASRAATCAVWSRLPSSTSTISQPPGES